MLAGWCSGMTEELVHGKVPLEGANSIFDWGSPARPHRRLIKVASVIAISLLMLVLSAAVWGAVYLLNSARL